MKLTLTTALPRILDLQIGRVLLRTYRGAPLFGVELHCWRFCVVTAFGRRFELRVLRP